ncbi:MAG TPA: alanine--tRNA ligase, partial [Pyrinomonadaceae bacterium]|nr:alanine--tRNA ligase [Pyrinomonadaceae bacterium]
MSDTVIEAVKERERFMSLTADDLRTKYLEFFKERGHAVIPSASLIPENDPSVLFTTAGMHPLVPYLVGRPHPAGKRLVGYQKCVRTNDIEEVGDSSHLTFFEMLGNWSLGDYFKKESISWSYEFLTRPDCLNLPADRIYVSVFAGDENAPRDEEAAAIWRSLGIPDERIVFLSAEHNWWAAGEEGPCGPDTEIFIDVTQQPCERGKECIAGVCGCGRFFEIWNNVFMSYNRSNGVTTPLPNNNVDTGMGLERTLAVLNGVDTVFETSGFQPIVQALIAVSEYSNDEMNRDTRLLKGLRVISDHLRTAVFILGDEKAVTPSNQGQGYVLRRLIRRAIRFCGILKIPAEKWAEVAAVVVDNYGEAYPELRSNSDRIHKELSLERERFQQALGKGTRLLEQEIEKLKSAGVDRLPGDFAFRLYDTYGFPIEFTRELASENGIDVDLQDFRDRFEEHRAKSKTEAARSGLADLSEESIRYHTATHLLHTALRKVLGEHVQQKGSNITRQRLRFDFTHPRPMTPEEIAQTEQLVQSAIDRELPVTSEVMKYTDAVKSG